MRPRTKEEQIKYMKELSEELKEQKGGNNKWQLKN
jgi:hypothetical protein